MREAEASLTGLHSLGELYSGEGSLFLLRPSCTNMASRACLRSHMPLFLSTGCTGQLRRFPRAIPDIQVEKFH